jgi:hypothetical protein
MLSICVSVYLDVFIEILLLMAYEIFLRVNMAIFRGITNDSLNTHLVVFFSDVLHADVFQIKHDSH